MWKRVGVPVLGMVENMAYMLAPLTGEKIALFPRGEMDHYLESAKIRKLAQIPFNPAVGMGSEAGIPIVESQPESSEAKCFFALADQLINITNN